jgi:hypothetical protein
MTDTKEIRAILVEMSSTGSPETVAAVNNLKNAHAELTVVSDTTTRATMGVQKALESRERQLDSTLRAQQRFNAIQKDLRLAYNEGLIPLERFNALSVLNTAQLQKATAATTPMKEAMNAVRGAALGLAAGIGPVGAVLGSFGPLGLVAAVGLGAADKAFTHMISEANRMGEVARAVREFSESTGLSTSQAQALVVAGVNAGIAPEQTQMRIQRLTATMEELRLGTGTVLAQIRRLDDGPALANLLLRTRDEATAIDLLAAAWSKADTAQRAALSKALFGGRGGIAEGAVLGVVADAGSLAAYTAAQQKNIILSKEQVDVFSTMKTQADAAGARVKDLMASWWTGPFLENQKQAREEFEALLRAAHDFATITAPSWWAGFREWSMTQNRSGTQLSPQFHINEEFDVANANPLGRLPQGNVPFPQPRPGATPGGLTPEAQIKQYQDIASVLGSAITPTEKLTAAQFELSRATRTAGLSNDILLRGMAARKLAEDQATLSIRERLGIASEIEIRSVQMKMLDDDTAKGAIKNAKERATAEAVVAKSIEQTVRTMEIAKAALPGLKGMELDAASLRGQIDTFSTTSLTNLTTGLTDVVMGTTKASDAFKNLGTQVARSLVEMTLKMAVMAPLAASLQSTLGLTVGASGGGGLLSLLMPGAGLLTPGSGIGATDSTIPLTGMGGIGHAHTGGIVGLTNFPTSYVHPAYFDNAPRFQSGGIVGGEVPIVAHKGEGVFTPGQMAAMGSGSSANLKVEVHNYHAGADIQTSQRSDGTLQVIVQQVTQHVTSAIANDMLRNRGPLSAVTRRSGLQG